MCSSVSIIRDTGCDRRCTTTACMICLHPSVCEFCVCIAIPVSLKPASPNSTRYHACVHALSPTMASRDESLDGLAAAAVAGDAVQCESLAYSIISSPSFLAVDSNLQCTVYSLYILALLALGKTYVLQFTDPTHAYHELVHSSMSFAGKMRDCCGKVFQLLFGARQACKPAGMLPKLLY